MSLSFVEKIIASSWTSGEAYLKKILLFKIVVLGIWSYLSRFGFS